MRTDLHSNQRTLMAEAKISGFTVFSTAKFVRKKTRADLPKPTRTRMAASGR
jgi:hypothetical protein